MAGHIFNPSACWGSFLSKVKFCGYDAVLQLEALVLVIGSNTICFGPINFSGFCNILFIMQLACIFLYYFVLDNFNLGSHSLGERLVRGICHGPYVQTES